jgi:predicted metal-dependent HD superfamily phosphohydrolase
LKGPGPMHTDEDAALLMQVWGTLSGAAGFIAREAMFEGIEAAYSGPLRHYHNVHHVAECIREFGPVRASSRNADAVAAALLFHDIVYDSARADNEERSADVAADYLRNVGKSDPFVEDVRALILATKHSAEPQTDDTRIVVDVDLSILGKPAEQFDAYERAIRLEYGHVPEEAFRAGRSRVLRAFLERPSIYATPHFRGLYEQPASRNLRRSIERLS